MKNQKRQKEAGFTLIEAAVSLVLLSFFALSILMFIKPTVELWVLQIFQQGPAIEGRLGLMRMVREINQVENRTSISTANASTFTFTRFTETGGTETVTYTTSSGNLTRNGVVLAKGVSGFSFQYFNKDNGTPAANADIRRVQTTFTVAAGGRTATLRSQAHPRNLF